MTSPARNVAPSVGARIRGTGGEPAVIVERARRRVSSVPSDVVSRAV